MRLLLLIISFISIVNANAQTVVNFTTPGFQTWVCPSNVSQITVQCWGGGGGGGSSSNNFVNGGCGGGGGAFSQMTNVTVIPGNVYYLFIGTGGQGAPSNSNLSAANGSDSWFNDTNTIPNSNSGVLAKGGQKGLNNYTLLYPIFRRLRQ